MRETAAELHVVRRPEPTTPARMEQLATLPVFFKLAGRRVVIAGGNEAATWKVELMAAAGAIVDVYAAEPCEEMARLTDVPSPRSAVERVRGEGQGEGQPHGVASVAAPHPDPLPAREDERGE